MSLPANAEDTGLVPGLRRSSGEGNGNTLQYCCLGNPMDRGGWQAKDHGVTKSQTSYFYTENFLLLFFLNWRLITILHCFKLRQSIRY